MMPSPSGLNPNCAITPSWISVHNGNTTCWYLGHKDIFVCTVTCRHIRCQNIKSLILCFGSFGRILLKITCTIACSSAYLGSIQHCIDVRPYHAIPSLLSRCKDPLVMVRRLKGRQKCWMAGCLCLLMLIKLTCLFVYVCVCV